MTPKRLSVLVWIGYVWLLGMTPWMSWVAWSRYQLRSELDSIATGHVISESRGQGRSPSHNVQVGFTIDGHIYYAAGNTKEANLEHVDGRLDGREVTVYYNAKNPSRASLTRGAGYEEVSAFAAALVVALLVSTYWLLVRRRRVRASEIPEATIVHE